jgi:hypothetical protein
MDLTTAAECIKCIFYFLILFYGFYFIEKITDDCIEKKYFKISNFDLVFLKLFYTFVCLKFFGFFPFN